MAALRTAVLGFLFVVAVGYAIGQTPTPQNPLPLDKPRVFITDSQSWEIRGAAGGVNDTFGAETHGGARPQTAEIIKTFGERCPSVTINNQQAKADYIVVLDHEGGKGYLRHRNKVAVFDRQSGDSVMSKSTLSLGGSVEDACKGIMQHWATRPKAANPDTATLPSKLDSPTPSSTTPKTAAKLTVTSVPDGADIEVDGNFMGNTPSSLELLAGDHVISVKKTGYKTWERKMRVSAGDIAIKAELAKED